MSCPPNPLIQHAVTESSDLYFTCPADHFFSTMSQIDVLRMYNKHLTIKVVHIQTVDHVFRKLPFYIFIHTGQLLDVLVDPGLD